MNTRLLFRALIKFLSGLLLLGLLLFIPAGTFLYWNALLLIAALFFPMILVGVVLFVENPMLLEKRLNTTEKEPAQRLVIMLSVVMFLGGFIIAGLDFRFQWLPVPLGVVIAATVIFLLAYAMHVEVLRENMFLSRTIEVQKGQKVVDTGLYGVVRHPMYTATLFLFLSMPLILGSFISFLFFLLYPILLVRRIKNEEKVLELGLEGYTQYKQRVKYRLIPFIW